MSDLPDKPNVFGKSNDEVTFLLENMCIMGLGIPVERLHHWERPYDYDAYRIHMVNGLEFVVSGPQVELFRRTTHER